MATTVKIIKSKEFTANGEKHVHYTTAYKGRVFGVSTLRFEKDDFTVKDTVLTFNTNVEVKQHVSVDELTGKSSTFLDIVPKIDLSLATF